MMNIYLKKVMTVLLWVLLGWLFLLGAAGIVFLIHCVRKFNIVAVLSRGNKAASMAIAAALVLIPGALI